MVKSHYKCPVPWGRFFKKMWSWHVSFPERSQSYQIIDVLRIWSLIFSMMRVVEILSCVTEVLILCLWGSFQELRWVLCMQFQPSAGPGKLDTGHFFWTARSLIVYCWCLTFHVRTWLQLRNRCYFFLTVFLGGLSNGISAVNLLTHLEAIQSKVEASCCENEMGAWKSYSILHHLLHGI